MRMKLDERGKTTGNQVKVGENILSPRINVCSKTFSLLFSSFLTRDNNYVVDVIPQWIGREKSAPWDENRNGTMNAGDLFNKSV